MEPILARQEDSKGALIAAGAFFLLCGLARLPSLIKRGFIYGGEGGDGDPIVFGSEAWLTVLVLTGGGLALLLSGVRRWRHRRGQRR